MSAAGLLFALLGQNNTKPGPVFDPGASGTGPTGTTLSPIPARADATITAMRPDPKYAFETYLVGPTRQHKSLLEAVPAANAARAARMKAAGRTTPNHTDRANFVLDPGTYDHKMAGLVLTDANVYAADPSQTTEIVDGLNAVARVYWEGVDITRGKNDAWEPKYCLHLQGIGGTSIFADCDMWNKDSKSGGGGTWAGMDTGENCTIVFYKVNANSTTESGQVAIGTNLHGPTSTPATIIWANSTSTGGLKWTINNGQPTELWVINTTAPSIEATGETAATKPRLHLAGSTITANRWDGESDTRSDWPIPVGGHSAYWRSTYGI